MRWFGLLSRKRAAPADPEQQQALFQQVRQGFNAHQPVPFAEQAEAVARLLDGDDGLAVAAAVLREFTDAAFADLSAQAAGLGLPVDRANYRYLFQASARRLRWNLFALPGGLQPYIQVAGAVTAIGRQARRAERVTDPEPLLACLFEVLDLTLAGWEYARVLVDVDAATLAEGLVVTTRELRAAMSDPPPLPQPVREMMRRKYLVEVRDPSGGQVVGSYDPGRSMRESLLL